MDKADKTSIQKKRKRGKRPKNKKITTNNPVVLKPPIPTIKRALLDLQTIESMDKICNEIKKSMPCDNLVAPVTVCTPQIDSLVTYAAQSLIIRPQSIVPESPENIVFGEPDAQVAEEDIILPGCYWGAVGEIPSASKPAIDNMEKIFNKLKL